MSENAYKEEVTQDDLAQFDDVFEEASGEDEFESVPDDKYQIIVDRVELTRTKTNGDPMLTWELRIISGEYEGRKMFRNNVMASKENVTWLKKDLNKCGVKLNKLSELPLHLERLLDVQLEVTKRTRDENENIYFKQQIEAMPTVDESDIPF